MTTANGRTADYPIDPMFLERWSPRSFTGEAISEADLMTMLEAARWAPSSGNGQPWRFVYAHRDTEHWERLLGVLVPFNQSWAKNAAALVVLVSKATSKKPGTDELVTSPTHSLDAGTASGYLMLQAKLMGWFVHGMAGIDYDRAATELKVPEGFQVQAVYAVGKLDDPEKLPEALKAREQPNDRVPLKDLVFEGAFGG